MNKSEINKHIIARNESLLMALKRMDEQKVKTLFVFEGDHFEGLLTLGDIQRAIIKNNALSEDKTKIEQRLRDLKVRLGDEAFKKLKLEVTKNG